MTKKRSRWNEIKKDIKIGLKTFLTVGTLAIGNSAYAEYKEQKTWEETTNKTPTQTEIEWNQTNNKYDNTPIPQHREKEFTATLRNIIELNSTPKYTLFTDIMSIQDGELRAEILATIAAESTGKPHVTSKSGVLGLMQVTYETAIAHGGIQIDSYEEMRNPQLSLEAGINIWNYNRQFFNNYTDKVEFAGAAYNAGPRVIERLVKKAAERLDNPNPTYEETMQFLTTEFLAAMDPDGYGTWSQTNLRNKVQEIKNHGYKTAQYYAVARERGLHKPEMTYRDPTFVGPTREY